MGEMEQPEAVLKSIGLTEYEAKAFVSLLRYGTLTAEKISEMAHIPLPRVYDTITELQRKGFVLVSKTRPKVFKAVPAATALERYTETRNKHLTAQLETMKARVKDAAEVLSHIEPELVVGDDSSNIWSTQKRANVSKLLDEIKKCARKDVAIFAGDMSWIWESSDVLRSMVRKGIHVRVILKDPTGNKKIAENIRKAKQLGLSVRSGYAGDLRAHVADSCMAIVISKIPLVKGAEISSGEPGTDSEFRYEFMTIDSQPLVTALRENFENCWKQLK
ncbi:MAG: helix-turn-helix domain-containing protein [Candidatus Aenigmatarchaeota archaeon]